MTLPYVFIGTDCPYSCASGNICLSKLEIDYVNIDIAGEKDQDAEFKATKNEGSEGFEVMIEKSIRLVQLPSTHTIQAEFEYHDYLGGPM